MIQKNGGYTEQEACKNNEQSNPSAASGADYFSHASRQQAFWD